MKNIPLTNIAVSLSGGGYRATTFHLGALSLLDALEIAPGSILIADKKKRKNGATLLENVRIISTISGGTLTGIMYALKLSQRGDFKDCYYKLHDLLAEDRLVDLALDKLNSTTSWQNAHKNRNVINSFSEVYHEHFYDGATFGDLYRDKDSHLSDLIFGASEFTAGLQYRFQQSGSGRFGGGELLLPKEIAERIRLADAAASSSCFPGGFEPMTMPTDFSNGPESRVEEWWVKKRINFEKEATLALAEVEKAAREVAVAARQSPELAARISSAFEHAYQATTKATKDAAKLARAEKRVKKAGTEDEAKKATEKADKAKVLASASAIEAKNAAVASHDLSAQSPELAASIQASLAASRHAAAAVKVADKAVKAAIQKADISRKDAAEKNAFADEQLEIAQAAHELVDLAPDMTAALIKAEKAAVEAEEASVAAKKAATDAEAASADVSLIFAERAAESVIRARTMVAAALKEPKNAELLTKAVDRVSLAQIHVVDAAEAASQAVYDGEKSTGQAESCVVATILAESTSTKAANHAIYDGDRSIDGKVTAKNIVVKSRETSAKTEAIEKENAATDAAALKARAVKKANAEKAAEATETAIGIAVALGGKTKASLAQNPSRATALISLFLKAVDDAVKAAQVSVEKSTFSRNEKAFHPTTAIMDGGILDNQGIKGVVMAENRHSNKRKSPFVGTYIISDVSGETMAPYVAPPFPNSAFTNYFTLKRINYFAGALFVGIIALLVLINKSIWGIVVASVFLTLIALWFVLFFSLRTVFRARVKATFAGEELPEIMQDLKVLINTPLNAIIYLIMFRATSALKMITDVFLRRIRSLQLHGLYKSSTWNYRIVSNNIYELKDAPRLTPALKKVINAANRMPTTLWFSQKEKDEGALDDLIACGQLTLCRKLADYLHDLKKGRNKELIWDEIEEYHQEIDEVLEVLELYWQSFRVDPHWLVRRYAEDRKEREQKLA